MKMQILNNAMFRVFLGRHPGFPGYCAVAERLAQLVCGGS